MDLFSERGAKLILVCKSEIYIVRPACVPCNKHRMQIAFSQLFLQCCQGFHRKVIVFRQCGNKAISTVSTEPDSVAGKQIFVIDEIHHMSPGMTGNEEAFDFDAVNVDYLSVRKQHFFVFDRDLRQLIKMIDDLAAYLTSQIAVFNFTDLKL